MSPVDFWKCDLWEVLAIIEGQQMKEERTHRAMWEMFRFNAFYSVLPHSKKNTLKKPRDIAAFPWDIQIKPISKEERKALFDRIKKMDKVK